MQTRIVRKQEHIDALSSILRDMPMPFTISWTKGEKRKAAQNNLSHVWYAEISKQSGDSFQNVRATCKLHFGVPILREENDAFRVSYDRVFRPLEYQTKLEAVRDCDLPVTRMMTVGQMRRYLDAVHLEYTSQGLRLTDPEALKYEMEF